MEVEERYNFSGADCVNYRRALDAAAAGGGADRAIEGTPSSNSDWRYRIGRWMLRVSTTKIAVRDIAMESLSKSSDMIIGNS
jgi:hypothetical protein